MKIISASIDLTKINKSKIINGKKGKYYNLTITVFDNKDQYGNNVSLTEPQDKKQREAKESKVYLGNGKVVYSTIQNTQVENNAQPLEQDENKEDDLPF